METETTEREPASAVDHANPLPARIRRGDRSAAATLFARHGDLVYRYFRGCGAPRDEAEDLTQDVFLRAIAGAGTYRGRASVPAWLLGIARNRLVDHARAEAARARREETWARERNGPGGCRGADAAASDPLLRRLLGELSPEDREVIVLAKFLELPGARIAEILEITAGAARVRLHRALERLSTLHEKDESHQDDGDDQNDQNAGEAT